MRTTITVRNKVTGQEKTLNSDGSTHLNIYSVLEYYGIAQWDGTFRQGLTNYKFEDFEVTNYEEDWSEDNRLHYSVGY